MATSNASADDGSPVVSVDDQPVTNGTHNLTVSVLCKVNGTRTPLADVNVTVCTMNITTEDNRTVVEIVQVAEGQTDENGTVVFPLAEGKYFVFAEHNGLRGFCRGNLGEDQMVMIKMHHWNWGHMKGQKFQYMNQFADGRGGCGMTDCQNCTGDQDRLHDGTGDMTGLRQGAGNGHQ
jgi:hypothetical protein